MLEFYKNITFRKLSKNSNTNDDSNDQFQKELQDEFD